MKNVITLLLVTLVTAPLLADANDIVPGDVFAAINLKNMDAVSEMLRNDKDAVLAARTNTGITPLHYAASLDATEAVYRLLEAGVDVNIQTEGSLTTPLHWAADRGASDTLRLLLKMGANVQAQAKNGYTALHFLARGSVDPAVARYLIEAGADINTTDARGNTPLHIAAVNGHASAVKYFIELKARTDLKNRDDLLAAEMAKDEATKLAFEPANPLLKKTMPVPAGGHAETVSPTFLGAIESTSRDFPIVNEVQPAPAETVQRHDRHASVTNENAVNILAVGEEYRQFMNDPDAIKNSDGSVYKGELRDGDYHGYGTLCLANRERYQGEWRRGLRHGVGTFTYSNGDMYNGGWRNHVPHGGGVFLYANGGRVNGSWKEGVLVEGDGFYVSADGSKFRGVWRNGKLLDSHLVAPTSNAL